MVDKPLRITVADVFKTQAFAGLTAAGKVESGVVETGSKVVVVPAGIKATVRAVMRGPRSVRGASAGDNVELNLAGVTPLQIKAGDVLCSPYDRIPLVQRFEAQIQTLASMGDMPLFKGQQLVLHTQNLEEPCNLAHLRRLLDRHGNVKVRKPKLLTRNVNAVVVIKCSRPIPLHTFADHRRLGRFLLRYSGRTVAAGMVLNILK